MGNRTCGVEGCGRPHSARGYCTKHYEHWRVHGDPVVPCTTPDRPCVIVGCGRPVKAKSRGLCGMHDERRRLFGSTDDRPKGNRDRVHAVDEHYFDIIDTPDKAYWLGFIAGDGYVRVDRGVLIVRLAGADEGHLRKLSVALGSSAPLRLMRGSTKAPDNLYAGLWAHSMPLVRALASHGVGQAKSLALEPWTGPDHLMRHYWRGLVDADGTLMVTPKQWQVSLVGTKAVVSAFGEWARTIVPRISAQPSPNGNIWRFAVRGRVCCRAVAEALYGDCSTALDRKLARAQSLIAAGPAKRVGHPSTPETNRKIGDAARQRYALRVACSKETECPDAPQTQMAT